jgi:hypothetical protein
MKTRWEEEEGKEGKKKHVEYLFICMDPSRIMAEPYD